MTMTMIAGLKTMPIQVDKVFQLLHELQAQGVRYGLGSKAVEHSEFPRFDYPPELPDNAIDCSGFMRVALYHATAGDVLLPDGSANQGDYLLDQGYKRSTYANCLLRDGHVRVCIARAGGRAGRIGHVWGCYMGYTFESHGGAGPASRAVDTPVLTRIVDEVYVVA